MRNADLCFTFLSSLFEKFKVFIVANNKYEYKSSYTCVGFDQANKIFRAYELHQDNKILVCIRIFWNSRSNELL